MTTEQEFEDGLRKLVERWREEPETYFGWEAYTHRKNCADELEEILNNLDSEDKQGDNTRTEHDTEEELIDYPGLEDPTGK